MPSINDLNPTCLRIEPLLISTQFSMGQIYLKVLISSKVWQVYLDSSYLLYIYLYELLLPISLAPLQWIPYII